MDDHVGVNCSSCDSSRRNFLRDASSAALALAALLALDPARGAALPIRFARGRRSAGLDVRYAIPPTDGAVIDREHELILMRHQGHAYAFKLSCPHQRTMLKWLEDQGRFQCPKHKSKYQPDGSFISGRATRGMDRLAIRLDGSELVVDPTLVYRDDKDAAGWTAAFVALP